ncbi:MAG: hypothetical protein FJ148_15390 [Deltaproteobacteria bacterium]|nr:hypothetical protein [Deltaproteobacteria bacterium]
MRRAHQGQQPLLERNPLLDPAGSGERIGPAAAQRTHRKRDDDGDDEREHDERDPELLGREQRRGGR